MSFSKDFDDAHKVASVLTLSVRGLLIVSVLALLISTFLILFLGFYHDTAYGFMVISVYGAIFVYYFAIPALIGVGIYYRSKKVSVWPKIKKELILLGISIACLLTAALVNHSVVPRLD